MRCGEARSSGVRLSKVMSLKEKIKALEARLAAAEKVVEAARLVYNQGPHKPTFDAWLKLRYCLETYGADAIKEYDAQKGGADADR